MHQNEKETQKIFYFRPINYSSNQDQYIVPKKASKDPKPVNISNILSPIEKLSSSQNPGFKFTLLVAPMKSDIS